MDRLAQFFIKPDISEDAVSREVLAVNSENEKNQQSDGWRKDQLLRSLAAKGHPYHKFGTGSNVTLNVMLSAPDAYEGGGTYFHASRKTVRLRQGQVLIHPGRLVHKSAPVTGGRRHILVAFTTFTNITVGDTAHQTATFANRDEIKINA